MSKRERCINVPQEFKIFQTSKGEFLKDGFNLVEGVHVSNLDGINEEYAIEEYENIFRITINVSAENIDSVFRELCARVRTPGFLMLEHGTNQNIEKQLRKSDTDPMHIDVFYLDGLESTAFFALYNQYNKLLVNDGVISFGFGSHICTDEVYVGPYKIFTIFTNETEKYIDVLKKYNIPQVHRVKTIWNNFSEESPGSRMTIKVNGIDIYEMIEQLSKKGLYLGERREE
ncbi:hypothetical protein EHE19_007835 [Ruminiclostridium herbifermentans]|uniref:Uncharacterized protein n=1 Tax=Ruminiclostridium herbifermentans TaxID=2488810 RepID=A0A4U7JLQ1_9FIRM|nr:hypothetical protein [Ruminiclostridium herbifermentans]QNU68305.1 hypothetical protein EHE19_007835 [Ruminiclostridium herbifermentans]